MAKGDKRIGIGVMGIGIILLLVEGGALAALTVVAGPSPTLDAANSVSCSGLQSCTVTVNVLANDVVVIFAGSDPSNAIITPTGCTMNAVPCVVRATYGTNVVGRLFVNEAYQIATISGVASITYTMSAPGAWTLGAMSVTGANLASIFDGNGNSNGPLSCSTCTVSLTTSISNDLIISAIFAQDTTPGYVVPSGFTGSTTAIVPSWMSSQLAAQSVATVGTKSPSWTLTSAATALPVIDAIQGTSTTITTTPSTSSTSTIGTSSTASGTVTGTTVAFVNSGGSPVAGVSAQLEQGTTVIGTGTSNSGGQIAFGPISVAPGTTLNVVYQSTTSNGVTYAAGTHSYVLNNNNQFNAVYLTVQSATTSSTTTTSSTSTTSSSSVSTTSTTSSNTGTNPPPTGPSQAYLEGLIPGFLVLFIGLYLYKRPV